MNNHSLYIELEYQQADFNRLTQAWQKVMNRHSLLQGPGSNQYSISLIDLRDATPSKIRTMQKSVRENLLTIPLTANEWPWFTIKALQLPGDTLQFCLAFAPEMIDNTGIYVLLREWLAFYQNPNVKLHPITLAKPSAATKLDYELSQLRYTHLLGKVDQQTYLKLHKNSHEQKVSFPLSLAAVFNEQMVRQKLAYPLRLTLANRLPLYPYSADHAFFATSLASTPLTMAAETDLQHRCQTAEKTLRKTAMELNPEIVQACLAPATPELFTLFSCNLEQQLAAGPLYAKPADILYANFALPLPVIDVSVWEQGGQLLYRWSYLDVQIKGAQRVELSPAELEALPISRLLNIKLTDDEESTAAAPAFQLKQGVMLLGAGLIKGLNNLNPDHTGALAEEQPTLNGVDILSTKLQQETAFNNVNPALDQLATNAPAWQKAPNIAAVQTKLPAPSPDYIAALKKMPTESPAVQFAIQLTALSTIAATMTAASASSQIPPAPTPAQLTQMPPQQVPVAYQQYAEQRAAILAEPIAKTEATNDALANQYRGMVVAAGPSTALVKPELTQMGGHLDELEVISRQGDATAIQAKLVDLQKSHEALVTKMDQLKIPTDFNSNPLNQKLQAIDDAFGKMQSNPSTEATQNFNNAVDSYVTEYNQQESIAQKPDTSMIDQASSDLKTAQEQSANDAKLQEINQDLDNLQTQIDQLNAIQCPEVGTPEGQATFADTNAQTEQLLAKLPQTSGDPVADKLGSAESNLEQMNEASSKLSQLEEATKTTEQEEELKKYQDKLGALQGDASTMAQDIQAKCPICAALQQKPTTDNAKLPEIVNPFDKASAELARLRAQLEEEANAALGPAKKQLQDVQDRMKAYDPTAKIDELKAQVQNAADNNPFKKAQEKVAALQAQLTEAQDRLLASCAQYRSSLDGAPSPKQKLDDAQANLAACQDRLTTLAQGGPNAAMSMQDAATGQLSQVTSLKDGVISQISQILVTPSLNPGLPNAADTAKSLAESAVCLAHQIPLATNGGATSSGGADPKEALVAGVQIKCGDAAGTPPKKVRVLPLGVKADGKNEFFKSPIDAIPFVTIPSMGSCISKINPINVVKAAVGAPLGAMCFQTVFAFGGAKKTFSFGMPVGQMTVTQFICPLASKVEVTHSGQNGPEKIHVL